MAVFGSGFLAVFQANVFLVNVFQLFFLKLLLEVFWLASCDSLPKIASDSFPACVFWQVSLKSNYPINVFGSFPASVFFV